MTNGGRRVSPRMAAFAVAAVMALDTADQSAIGATAPQVRTAFDISQTQIGVLATSSTLVGVAFALPFGILADRANRLRILRTTVVVWVVAMLGVGAAPQFWTMLVAHGVLGLVTGAAGPLIVSMAADLVPAPRRGRVFTALLLGELSGSIVGLAVPGEVAALAGWRWAFWSLAVVGLLVFALLSRIAEPERGAVDDVPHDASTPLPLLEALRVMLRNRTLVLLVLASALGYYFFAGVQTFAVSLLRDSYGVSASVAPLLVLAVGVSLAVGVLIGGFAGDRLLRARPRRGRLPLLVVAFGGSLAFIVPALVSTQVGVLMPLLVVGGVLLGTANPPLDATRVDIVAPLLRGRAEATRTAIKDGADASAPVLFGAVGGAIGLRPTFVVMTSTLAAALLLCLLAVRTYPGDARRVAQPEEVR